MFDLNGDGDVDCEEFEMVATLVRQQTSIGSRHRDHANTGNTFKVSFFITTYFLLKPTKTDLYVKKITYYEKKQKNKQNCLYFLINL